MGALQVLLIATSALLVLENGFQVSECAPSGTYSYTTRLRSSSSNNAISPSASRQRSAVQTARSYRRSELSDTDYRKYLPVEDTPEVKKAREQFFTLYEKQAKLAAEAEDNDLDGTYTQSHVAVGTRGEAAANYDYFYYDEEEDEDSDEYEEDDDEEEEEEEDSDEEEDDDDEDEEDSDEEEESEEDSDEYGDDSSSSSSSSSSEEDYYGDDSSEEDGSEDSSSEESSEELWGEEDSSSSSSSSEEDGEGLYSALSSRTTSRGRYQPLNTNALLAPKPVTDTPEVKQAKRDFFDLYKTQAELSFNAADER